MKGLFLGLLTLLLLNSTAIFALHQPNEDKKSLTTKAGCMMCHSNASAPQPEEATNKKNESSAKE